MIFRCLLRLYLMWIVSASVAAIADASMPARQGEVARIPISIPNLSGQPNAVTCHWDEKPVACFRSETGWVAWVGVDLDHPEGTTPLRVAWQAGRAAGLLTYPIEVRPASFGVQTLTVPKEKDDLSAETLKRIQKEAALFTALWDSQGDRQYGPPRWVEPFIVPVSGRPSGTFGRRRIINALPRNPHTGEDIPASSGTPVAASNAGVVVLTGAFYFNGNSVVIDHGAGLFSMYFHLRDMAVAQGEAVARGAVVGHVGQSGRATGPHLHWGARLGGARVDPFSLVEIQDTPFLAHEGDPTGRPYKP